MKKKIFTFILVLSTIFTSIGCTKQEPNRQENMNFNVVDTLVSETEETKENLVDNSATVETEEKQLENQTEIQKETQTTTSTVKKEEVKKTAKSNTVKQEVVSKPQVDNREKVTMIDKNTIYMDNVIYYQNVSTIEDYIARVSIPKVTISSEYKEVETALITALSGTDETFTYSLPKSVGSFVDDFKINHMTYGDCSASLSYSCPRQSDGTYLFTVNLTSTRTNIANAQTEWNKKVESQKQTINNKLSHNQEFNKQNALYKEKVNQCVVAAGITNGMAVEDAIKKIDAYIRQINSYDYGYTYCHFSDVFNHGKSVCNGYATLFFMMAQRCGIDCQMVSSAKMNHIWNVVKFDGKTLYVDSTWNDTSNSSNYLLVSKEQLAKTHNFSDAIVKSETHIVYH